MLSSKCTRARILAGLKRKLNNDGVAEGAGKCLDSIISISDIKNLATAIRI